MTDRVDYFLRHLNELVEKGNELHKIGRVNLEHLITQERREEKRRTDAVEYAKGGVDALTHAPSDPGDFVVEGVSLFGSLPIEPDQMAGVIESYARFGKQHFVRCSGCRHRSMGKCELLDQTVKTNDCLIPGLSPNELIAAMERLNARLQQKKGERTAVRNRISLFLDAKKKAPELPIFPRWREKDHFKTGDRVVVYAYSPAFRFGERDVMNKWLHGTYLAGWIVLDEPFLPPRVHTTFHPDLYKKASCQFFWMVTHHNVPFIMLKDEFETLLCLDRFHPYRSLWLANLEQSWVIEDVATQGKVLVSTDALWQEMAKGRPCIVPEAPEARRLMGATEAIRHLGLKVVPTTADEVVTAYRKAQTADAEKPLLRRAKDILLARIYGYTRDDVGGFL